jgi:hypothetical protein
MPISIRWIFIFCVVQSMLFAEEWNTVYLASFPRSGNHWVRFLAEEATGIITSSVYRDHDYPHLKSMFPWGGYCTADGYNGHCHHPTLNDPILLKTHYPFFPRKITPTPKSAICLIRHPIDAFWSFHTYREKNRGKEKNQAKMDRKTLRKWIKAWRKFYEFWENQQNVLLIRYEDLQVDTRFYLHCILEKAGFSFSDADIERAITKYPSQGQPLKHINAYDVELLEMIKTELADFLTRYNYDEI